MTLADQVESWKHEHPSGHCIRQSQAKKSQHIQSAKQWAWYGHTNWLRCTCMMLTGGERPYWLFKRHCTFSKSPTRAWGARCCLPWCLLLLLLSSIELIFCSHSISQSQRMGLPLRKNSASTVLGPAGETKQDKLFLTFNTTSVYNIHIEGLIYLFPPTHLHCCLEDTCDVINCFLSLSMWYYFTVVSNFLLSKKESHEL